jgi:hypothetical protein
VPQNDNEKNNPPSEATLSDNLAYGANRAQLNWFRAEVNALNKTMLMTLIPDLSTSQRHLSAETT